MVKKADIEKSVKVSKSGAFVQSNKIAKIFGKRHDNVLRMIENITISLLKIEESNHKYFKDTSYINSRGKEYKRYDLTRAGFDLLVLSFTGDKAFQYKVWFIDEFHRKSNVISEQQSLAHSNKESDMWLELRNETKTARIALTDAIQKYELPQRISEGKAHENFVSTRIMNYTQMIYKVLDVTLPSGSNPRDILSPRMLIKLEDAEYKVASQIKELIEVKNCHYKQTYQLIKKSMS